MVDVSYPSEGTSKTIKPLSSGLIGAVVVGVPFAIAFAVIIFEGIVRGRSLSQDAKTIIAIAEFFVLLGLGMGCINAFTTVITINSQYISIAHRLSRVRKLSLEEIEGAEIRVIGQRFGGSSTTLYMWPKNKKKKAIIIVLSSLDPGDADAIKEFVRSKLVDSAYPSGKFWKRILLLTSAVFALFLLLILGMMIFNVR